MEHEELLKKLDKRIDDLSLLEPEVLVEAIKRMQEKRHMTFNSVIEDMLLESYYNKYKKHMDENIKYLASMIEILKTNPFGLLHIKHLNYATNQQEKHPQSKSFREHNSI